MFGAARKPVSRLQLGGVGLFLCALLFWKAHSGQAAWARIEAYPHEQANVERTWVIHSKHSGRFADVSFGAGQFLTCRAKGLRVGPDTLNLQAGQSIEIAPRPGSCDAPDVPGSTPAPWFCAVLYGFSFLGGLSGLMILTGAWQLTPQSARAF